MMFETATAADLAEALKMNRPDIPKSTTASPEIQVWRQWCSDVRSIASTMFERAQDIKAFCDRAGMPTI